MAVFKIDSIRAEKPVVETVEPFILELPGGREIVFANPLTTGFRTFQTLMKAYRLVQRMDEQNVDDAMDLAELSTQALEAWIGVQAMDTIHKAGVDYLELMQVFQAAFTHYEASFAAAGDVTPGN